MGGRQGWGRGRIHLGMGLGARGRGRGDAADMVLGAYCRCESWRVRPPPLARGGCRPPRSGCFLSRYCPWPKRSRPSPWRLSAERLNVVHRSRRDGMKGRGGVAAQGVASMLASLLIAGDRGSQCGKREQIFAPLGEIRCGAVCLLCAAKQLGLNRLRLICMRAECTDRSAKMWEASSAHAASFSRTVHSRNTTSTGDLAVTRCGSPNATHPLCVYRVGYVREVCVH